MPAVNSIYIYTASTIFMWYYHASKSVTGNKEYAVIVIERCIDLTEIITKIR